MGNLCMKRKYQDISDGEEKPDCYVEYCGG